MHKQVKERGERGMYELRRAGTAGGRCLDIRGHDFVSRDHAEAGPDVREASSTSKTASATRRKAFVPEIS